MYISLVVAQAAQYLVILTAVKDEFIFCYLTLVAARYA